MQIYLYNWGFILPLVHERSKTFPQIVQGRVGQAAFPGKPSAHTKHPQVQDLSNRLCPKAIEDAVLHA